MYYYKHIIIQGNETITNLQQQILNEQTAMVFHVKRPLNNGQIQSIVNEIEQRIAQYGVTVYLLDDTPELQNAIQNISNSNLTIYTPKDEWKKPAWL